jgi:hypothetical protein
MAVARRPVGSALARGVAGILAVASVAPVCLGLAIAWLSIAVAAQRPDPSVPDGDPCCGHPDTWAEVVGGIGLGVAVAAICVAVLYLAMIFGEFAFKGARPRVLRLRRLIASLSTVLAVSAAYTAFIGAVD